jgi:hypothetical protein
MSEESTARPFVWSEIHELLKRKFSELDSTIRAEIGKPKAPIPEKGSERRHFLLLLEEKLSRWADVARDTAQECLKEIGREGSDPARSSVWNYGLNFFFTENLLTYLYIACGCYVERPYRVKVGNRPKTFTSLEVNPDTQQEILAIVARTQARIYSEWTRTGDRPTVSTNPLQAVTNPLLAAVDNLLLPSRPVIKQSRQVKPQEPTSPFAPSFVLSKDLRIARMNGLEYPLTTSQGKMLAVLWNAHQNGKLVTRSALCSAIGIDNAKCEPRNIWKGHPFWGSIIVSDKPGFYQLNLTKFDF